MSGGKDVAKSLHTISVLVQVARYAMRAEEAGPELALDIAMGALVLHGRPDPYGLRAKALAALCAA